MLDSIIIFFVIGGACIVVKVVLHAWASTGSFPEVLIILYNNMASINIRVEIFKSEAYGETFSFDVSVSCFYICEGFACEGYRSTILYQRCAEAILTCICLDDYGLLAFIIG